MLGSLCVKPGLTTGPEECQLTGVCRFAFLVSVHLGILHSQFQYRQSMVREAFISLGLHSSHIYYVLTVAAGCCLVDAPITPRSITSDHIPASLTGGPSLLQRFPLPYSQAKASSPTNRTFDLISSVLVSITCRPLIGTQFAAQSTRKTWLS